MEIIYLCNQCTFVRQEQSSHNAYGISERDNISSRDLHQVRLCRWRFDPRIVSFVYFTRLWSLAWVLWNHTCDSLNWRERAFGRTAFTFQKKKTKCLQTRFRTFFTRMTKQHPRMERAHNSVEVVTSPKACVMQDMLERTPMVVFKTTTVVSSPRRVRMDYDNEITLRKCNCIQKPSVDITRMYD